MRLEVVGQSSWGRGSLQIHPICGRLGTSGGDSARDGGCLAIGLEADEAGLGKGDAGLLGGALGIEVVHVRGADGALSELADF